MLQVSPFNLISNSYRSQAIMPGQGFHRIKAPNPETFFSHRNHSHSFRGSFAGVIILVASLVSLGMYLKWAHEDRKEVGISIFLVPPYDDVNSVGLLLPQQTDHDLFVWDWPHRCHHWTCSNQGLCTQGILFDKPLDTF